MELNENAALVLEKRYLAKDAGGKTCENAEELFRRVARAVALADRAYGGTAALKRVEDEFFEMMTNLEFLPNSPTLMNAGRPLGQLSACFVLPVEDSMEDIFESVKQAALIHKSGGGTGFSFSRLRAAGSAVRSTGGVASGPVSFMKVFNAATEAVKQGGTRRGANMGILRVDHPDILEFITCKDDNREITNFNISVAVTEEFMNAVREDGQYYLVDPKTKKAVAPLSARMVFDRIVDAAHKNGEPGIIFIDRINRDNTVCSQGEIESTNPCGEQPLLPFESCNLGSVNLMKMLKEEGGRAVFDVGKLKKTVGSAVHFLDNVIDVNRYPIEAIERTTKLTRKIGLGVMGFADMLLKMGIPYNSEEGMAKAREIMSLVDREAKRESAELAKRRGSFPLFEESAYKGRFEAMRNATVTTIAPTGTISIIAGVSSGIEPVFAYAFTRNVMDQTRLFEVNQTLGECLEQKGLYSEALMREISEKGSLADIGAIPPEVRRVFVSAHDVSPEWHVRMQAAFQEHTDNAVSKTVNFPQDASREDVRTVYMLAWELGCKGVTIYRDGSRDEQVLNIGGAGAGPEEAEERAAGADWEKAPRRVPLKPRGRPAVTRGITEKVRIGCGNLYITVNVDDEGICEVFTNTGRHGGCPSQSEATSRLVSIALRSGVSTDAIIEQLRGIRCPSTIRQRDMSAMSCPDAVARTIERVERDRGAGQAHTPKGDAYVNRGAPAQGGTCPECGAAAEHEGGCVVCRQCGYSKCG